MYRLHIVFPTRMGVNRSQWTLRRWWRRNPHMREGEPAVETFLTDNPRVFPTHMG
jgi:hypothetical protein